jgi:hypothetical protein
MLMVVVWQGAVVFWVERQRKGKKVVVGWW